MRLDATHRNWAIATAAATVLSTAVYIAYAAWSADGPRGDTWIGLGFGVAGFLMIAFAGFLSARKKMLLLRIGSVTWWMRGHLWLGALALPMILFHSAFALGGPLTTVLTLILFVVVGSGLLGAMLQHGLPGVVAAQVRDERTYEQLERVRWNLRLSAYERVAGICGEIVEAGTERADLEHALGHAPQVPRRLTPAPGDAQIRQFYLQAVWPFLRDGARAVPRLSTETSATLTFDNLRPRVDPTLHAALDDLAGVCRAARDLVRQSRLHRWLHAWLLVHVPLSFALLVLMTVHAIMALYY